MPRRTRAESNGTCDDATGVRGACASGYQGATCSECYPGYHAVTGGTCALDVPCTDTSCSGAGTCNASTGTAVCTCFAGHTGATCSTCASGYHRGSDGRCALDETCGASTCGTHGTCSVTAGVATCACTKGYAGVTCAECGPGFHSATGGTCELDQACGTTSCGGHGSCVDASGVVVCTCDTGFEGDHCETNSDDCGSNACGTGTCVDRTNDYICLCTDGTWGTSCP
ncbi:MAG: hypothetical protein U0169_22740 [Polyangiaceae bacterium]